MHDDLATQSGMGLRVKRMLKKSSPTVNEY